MLGAPSRVPLDVLEACLLIAFAAFSAPIPPPCKAKPAEVLRTGWAGFFALTPEDRLEGCIGFLTGVAASPVDSAKEESASLSAFCTRGFRKLEGKDCRLSASEAEKTRAPFPDSRLRVSLSDTVRTGDR